jgi:hypothetical protein
MRYAAFLPFILGIMCGLAPAAERDARRPAIGTLAPDTLQTLPVMCECEYFRGPVNGATTVFATRQARTVALASIDGGPVSLKPVSVPAPAACRRNVRHRERWAGGDVAVTLDLRATHPGAEACWFEGRMSVTRGGRTATAPVAGACGC